MEKISVNISSKVELTRQDIDDLMVTALEGGINYWCRKARVLQCPEEYTYASDVISRNGTLELYDIESSDKWVLTLESFMKGVKWYCEKYKYTNAEDLMDNHDADTADAIVQYALFNEIVFG